jgi:hypothetical protein
METKYIKSKSKDQEYSRSSDNSSRPDRDLAQRNAQFVNDYEYCRSKIPPHIHQKLRQASNLVDSLKEVVFSRKEHKDPSLAI